MIRMWISKDDKSTIKALRAAKTVFVLVYFLFSFLVFSAPVLVVIADVLLPPALLSASISSQNASVSAELIAAQISTYHFTSAQSLIDIPLLSLARSLIIICVYSLCDGPKLSRGPYLGITTICSVLSLVFVSVKASYVFGSNSIPMVSDLEKSSYSHAMEVSLFVCSIALAVGHTVVAYRISCRERRKMLVYKIDIEAVVSKNGFPSRYSKLLRVERMK